jgi:prepilin-type N-terminal cleavage/methylation domain-containing protein
MNAGRKAGAPPAMRARLTGAGRYDDGYTLIEVAVALTLSSLIVVSAYLSLVTLSRFYAVQTAAAEARDAARVATEVLAAELRAVSPGGGDLYAVGVDSVALRSTTGLGVICAVSGTAVSLRRVTGSFGDADTDSALLFVEGDPDTSLDDAWRAAGTREVRSGGEGACPDGRAPTHRVVFDRSVDGARVGSPVRGFRPYVYKLYRGRDRSWWLGQRLRNGRIQPLAGPFAAPGGGGLRLEYLDRSGRVTSDAARVAQVGIRVRARSERRVPKRGGAGFLIHDLSTAVYLRNR